MKPRALSKNIDLWSVFVSSIKLNWQSLLLSGCESTFPISYAIHHARITGVSND
jgi:hypothetical protein